MPRALVPLAPGFEDLEAVTLIDVLRRAGVEVRGAGLEGRRVQGARGTVIETDAAFETESGADFDLVALPGGQPGSDRLGDDGRVLDLLKRQAARGRWIGAVCAAPRVLARAGLIRGRRVTCYPGALDGLDHGAVRVDAPVVTDGRIVTGRSAGTALDFSLALVEALLGRPARDEVERRLER